MTKVNNIFLLPIIYSFFGWITIFLNSLYDGFLGQHGVLMTMYLYLPIGGPLYLLLHKLDLVPWPIPVFGMILQFIINIFTLTALGYFYKKLSANRLMSKKLW